MAWRAGGGDDRLGGDLTATACKCGANRPQFQKCPTRTRLTCSRSYLDAYSVFGLEEYASAARGIVRWVRETASDPEGGYAASQDADVGLDDDGDYFTWTRDEAAAALTAEELEVAEAYYTIGTAGEMHHNPAKNVLYVAATVPQLATRLGRPVEQVRATLERASARLLAARATRPAPFVDRTRDANWNAMMASALLEAARSWATRTAPPCDPHAGAPAPRARGRGRRAHMPGGVTGLLDDQVQVAAAALDAHETTGEVEWLAWAERLMDRVWTDYWDEAKGGLFDTARARDAGPGLLPARAKPVQDAPRRRPMAWPASCARDCTS